MSAPNVNTLWARVLVDELERCGVCTVVVSPGSRSTPLVVQFAEHPNIDDISIVDERSAAFFALGVAQAKDEPVALVCTSGTAAANYFPAICEASASDIPLIVLSADRPAELHDCGASQSMDQTKLYGGHVRWFHQVAQPEASADKLRYLRSLACRAVARAQGPRPGPVHLDLPFRKPLEPIEVPDDHRDAVPPAFAEDAPEVLHGRECGAPWVAISEGRPAPDEFTVSAFADRIASARRPLFLAGADRDGADYADALLGLAEHFGAPVVAEPTAGLRRRHADHPNLVSVGDFLFASDAYEQLGQPDLVIRTGRAPLLWSAQTLVRNLDGADQIVVSSTHEFADPDHLVCNQIVADPAALFEAAVLEEAVPPSAWLAAHQRAQQVGVESLGEALTSCEALSAARMWDELGQGLPDGAALFVSNSMPIRNLDTFMSRSRAAVDVHFNRGINGIDGINSTGLGVALGRRLAGNDAPSVIVTGDVALRHDLAALLLAGELGIDATVVVVDNDGGGIFEYLPIAQFDEVHERHFATSSLQPVERAVLGACELLQPADWPEFRAHLAASLERPGLQVIHVRTDRKADKELREELRKTVAARIGDAVRSMRS